MEELSNFLTGASSFIPHGHCYLWQPAVLWLNVISDFLIAAAYLSLPAALIYFVSKRRDLAFRPIFVMFGVFILACGLTHVMGIYTVWVPAYWLDGSIKAVTATVSLVTAVAVWPMIPKALALPSPVQLREINAELEQANQQLHNEVAERTAAEERFRGLLESAPDAMVIAGADGRIRLVNARTEEIFGYARDELIGQPIETLVPERFRARHVVHRENYLRNPRPRSMGQGFDLHGRRKDGSEFPVEISLSPAGGEKDLLVFADIRDVTEQRAMEQKIRVLNEELEAKVQERTRQLLAAQEELVRKEKLAVLGQVVGSVGHELRNPLGVMNNAVYYLKATLHDADSTTKEYLDIIGAEIAGTERIVSELLDSVRTRPPRIEMADVAYLIRQALQRCTVPEQVQVKVDTPTGLPPIEVDPQQIQQVFRNLFANGIDAMPDGGDLTVSTTVDNSSGMVRVTVRDTGTGIKPEQMQKLFQPLFTTKARGTGLGLAVVKNLTEANGGHVDVQSEVGKGTTFTVTLPVERGKT